MIFFLQKISGREYVEEKKKNERWRKKPKERKVLGNFLRFTVLLMETTKKTLECELGNLLLPLFKSNKKINIISFLIFSVIVNS